MALVSPDRDGSMTGLPRPNVDRWASLGEEENPGLCRSPGQGNLIPLYKERGLPVHLSDIMNNLGAVLSALGLVVVVTVILRLLKHLLLRHFSALASRTDGRGDPAVAILRRTGWLGYLAVALWTGLLAVPLPIFLTRAGGSIAVLAFLGQIGIWANQLIDYWTNRWKASEGGEEAPAFAAVALIARIVLVIILFVLALENLNVKVTTLLAGLGVGGLAVGLALQNVLGDVLASLAILWDKPFSVGDSIAIDTYAGTVERIGMRTTRIRSVSGEELVIPNADLVKGRIHNYRRLAERRVVLSLNVAYETEVERLAEIPAILRECIEGQEETRFERAHLRALGNTAVEFEGVYLVLSSDFTRYMEVQEAVNLGVLKRLQAAGVHLAYPTQTIYVARPVTSETK